MAKKIGKPARAAALLDESAFLKKTQAALDGGKPLGLVLLRSTRLNAIQSERGEDMAAQVFDRFAASVLAELKSGETLGRVGSDEVAALTRDAAGTRALAIHEVLRRVSRLPVAAGAAAPLGPNDTARALLERARQAAAKSPSEPGAPAAASPNVQDRYQRLVLLNRMSLELFSDKPFPEALASAGNMILALLNCPHAAIYFCDDFGSPYAAQRHGDPMFLEPDALGEEALLAAQALGQRRVTMAKGTRLGWVAAPLSPAKGRDPAEDGALVIGYTESRGPSADRDQTMLEICRQLRNARIIQRNLQQQRVLAAVTEQSADAIIITDLASRILLGNTSFEKLFGYGKAEILGMDAAALVPPDKREEFQALEDQARAAGGALFETVRQRKDAALVPVEGAYTLLKDDKGSPWGMVRVFRDITKRKEVDRMKSEFVSLVSHELRTPLTSIQGFAESLLDFGGTLEAEKRRHFLKIIVEESDRLGRLVTNFLDISRLESGAIAPQPELVDLGALCARLSALFREHPSMASFETALGRDAERVFADEDQVYRVLVNLCGNALKYTPRRGKVTISSRREGAFVEVCVADQGPGIAPEHRARVFDKFYRVADSVSRKTGGTGLGLAICKGIVEAHGGAIWVESQSGLGTRFLFTLPAPS